MARLTEQKAAAIMDRARRAVRHSQQIRAQLDANSRLAGRRARLSHLAEQRVVAEHRAALLHAVPRRKA